MMSDFDINNIDRIIHSPIRLGIMATLVSTEEVNFKFLKEKLNLTVGNLSANLTKLEEVGFITIRKFHFDKKPASAYKVTKKGRLAFKVYVANIEKIIKDI